MQWFYRDPCRPRVPDRQSGFTLLELLISVVVVIVILVTVTQFIGGVDRVYRLSANDPYADAENAFEKVAKTLEAATLESYGDYADKSGAFHTNVDQPFVPDHVAARSDLDFVCGTDTLPAGMWNGSGRTTAGTGLFFLSQLGYTQTLEHTGMERLLNAAGYFVEFGDRDATPSFVGNYVWRWRLKQILQPSENLQIYEANPSLAWIQNAVRPGAPTAVLADNVFLFIALPERAATDSGPALAPNYVYDSRDITQAATYGQLPVRVRLVLGAIDSSSAQVLANRYGPSPPALIPGNLFKDSTKLDADLAVLDQSLTAQKIGHRFFQRTLQISAATIATTSAP